MSARATPRDAGRGMSTGERFAVEPTAIGAQSLVPGVAPITAHDRLALRAAAPLEPRRTQRAGDHGLFDLAACDQFDLFQPPPSRRAAMLSDLWATDPALTDQTPSNPATHARRTSPAEDL